MINELHVLVKGLLIGFLIAVPVGPIGILCARRTLMYGRRAGFFSGMGAATADVIYGFIAAFGLTMISDFLVGRQFWFRLLGGAILCFIGLKTILAEPEKKNDIQFSAKHYAGMYTSTFLLTLTNPMTIFSFAAIFASVGLAGARGSATFAGELVLGVFLGSGLWWLFLVGVFTLFKKRFKHHELQWLNRFAGVMIAGSGAIAILSLL